MDALTQAIESYVSKGASPITDSLALEAAVLVGKNLKKVFYNGRSIEHRTAIAHGSLLAGIALANARLGGVHGMAHAIGSRCSIAHGTVCAVLLPYIVRFNWEYSKDKYIKIQEALEIDNLPQYIEDLNSSFDIPKKLGFLGLRRELFETIAAESLPSGSLKANPRQITIDDIYDILGQNL
jgi:alcohol dehydrogenase class IV